MDFYEVLANVIDILQREGRTSYRALKRQFDLDDDYLEDLKIELIEVKQCAVDQDSKMLVWTGGTVAAPSPPLASPSKPETAPAPAAAIDQEPPPISYTPQHLAEKILTSRSALEGERKQVTVMFADIKDSTELIRDLDPEAAQQLLDPAIHIMMNAVHRFEGTVNQVLGDGVMALFGAPIAHEDHAARACYAALAMQTAMKPYADEMFRSHGITMQIRVGLNSGEVVVRTIGNDLHMDYSAVGQTTNLASRMEQLATPGSIALTGATLRLVEGLVRGNTRGSVPVKGITEPVDVYELTGASSIRRRLQAAVARGLTKFVGRDTEIKALNQALEKAKAGNGQVVAAIGEAGLGKSRLFYEFIQSHRTQGWRVLESASVSYGKATPYFPIIDLLKRYAHVEDSDDARTIRAKLTGQVLTLDETQHEITPALLALCDVLTEDHAFHQLDPSQRRQRTLDALKRLLLRESQEQPLLLVFEDLHWIDSETQALLDSLVESLPTAQLLLLVNYRPEYQHTWGSKTFYTQLRLDPLPPESADVFLQALLGDDPSLASLKPLLIERTQGNPFFLEETVRTLVETEALAGEAGAYRLVQGLPSIQVPDTVQAILAARIDRLPQEEKQLLQTAAVIGTEVSLRLLQAIADLPEDALQRGLAHLQAAEFVYETQLFPECIHTFKHALTHEVVYGSLLQERRRVLHAQIVEALEAFGGDQSLDQVEQLAHHALRGDVWDKAFIYYHQAGTKAMARSAFREAIACFEHALASVQQLPEQQDRHQQTIDMILELRSAHLALGAPERALSALQTGERLAETLGSQQRLGRILAATIVPLFTLGDFDRASASAHRALELATTCNDIGTQILSHNYVATVYRRRGVYHAAIDHGKRAIALLSDAQAIEKRFGNVMFPVINSSHGLALSFAEIGAFAESIAAGEYGLQIAESLNNPVSLMYALIGAAFAHVRKGDIQQALPRVERSLRIAREADAPFFFSNLAPIMGEAYILARRFEDACSMLEQAVEQAVSHTQSWQMATWSRALLLSGRVSEAVPIAEQVMAVVRDNKEVGHEAHALHLLGDVAMHHNPPQIDQAQTHYHQALSLADELGMRPLQAHCYRGLGALHRQTGQAEQARAELSTAIEMYRDMEMTFWLPETEDTLAQLEGKA